MLAQMAENRLFVYLYIIKGGSKSDSKPLPPYSMGKGWGVQIERENSHEKHEVKDRKFLFFDESAKSRKVHRAYIIK